jgi:nascent polypeptide-associated complex subunit alpha
MFGGGGGGLDPSKMQQMMKQMGIDIEDIDAEEVVIRTADEELVFTDAEVQRMDAQGQQTYNIVGAPETRDRSSTSALEGDDGDDEADDDDGIPQEDIKMVANRAEVSAARAREALEAADGRPVEAINRLQ